jgi:predicted nuclease of predicted toxin-antitoxin system
LKLFFDECISPTSAIELALELGFYVAHPRNNGGVGDPDHKVLERCVAEDLVIVTENAADFRKLAARSEIHPGMIILPCVSRNQSKELILTAVKYLEKIGTPGDVIVNHVLEVSEDGSIEMYELPVS